jgi:hypothetical protein
VKLLASQIAAGNIALARVCLKKQFRSWPPVSFDRAQAKQDPLLGGILLASHITTGPAFGGAGGQTLGWHGYSKDHRTFAR